MALSSENSYSRDKKLSKYIKSHVCFSAFSLSINSIHKRLKNPISSKGKTKFLSQQLMETESKFHLRHGFLKLLILFHTDLNKSCCKCLAKHFLKDKHGKLKESLKDNNRDA